MFIIMNVEKLKTAIKIAGEKTISGLLQHMQYSEREDIRILLEREKKTSTIKNIVDVLSKNDSLLWGVYIHASRAEKQVLENLAERVA